MTLSKLFIISSLLLLVIDKSLSIEPRDFINKIQEDRYYQLISELRCLVCQNQNLADSNAPLAKDMRDQVYQLIIENKSNQEIKEFLSSRFSDFVLYKPPVNSHTVLLWGAPLLLLIIGFVVVILYLRKQN